MFDYVNYISGTRESYRLMGDVIFTENDFDSVYADACVINGWKIDLHCPDTLNAINFPNQEFRSTYCNKTKGFEYADVREDTLMMKRRAAQNTAAKTAYLPYRCLYSRNIENLFMAGRCVSVTHIALGSFRVMKTGGLMGEVVGRAVSLCKQHSTTPRGVYTDYLDELKALFERPVDDVVGMNSRNAFAPPPAHAKIRKVLWIGNRQSRYSIDSPANMYDITGRFIGNPSNIAKSAGTRVLLAH